MQCVLQIVCREDCFCLFKSNCLKKQDDKPLDFTFSSVHTAILPTLQYFYEHICLSFSHHSFIHSSVHPSRLLTVSTKQQELHTNNCPITNLGMAQSDSQDPNWSYFGQHFRTEHRKKTNNYCLSDLML